MCFLIFLPAQRLKCLQSTFYRFGAIEIMKVCKGRTFFFGTYLYTTREVSDFSGSHGTVDYLLWGWGWEQR